MDVNKTLAEPVGGRATSEGQKGDQRSPHNDQLSGVELGLVTLTCRAVIKEQKLLRTWNASQLMVLRSKSTPKTQDSFKEITYLVGDIFCVNTNP